MTSPVKCLCQVDPKSPLRLESYEHNSAIARLLNIAQPAIAQIRADNEEEWCTGTSFFIRHNLVATAWHVIEDAKKITVTTFLGVHLEAKFLRARTDLDLALVEVKADNTQPVLKLSRCPPRKRQRAFTVGYAEGRTEQCLSLGSFWRSAHTERYDWETDQLMADFVYHDYRLPARGGNSGGPILNRNGEVLSIHIVCLDTTDAREGYWCQTIPSAYLEELTRASFLGARGHVAANTGRKKD